MRHTVVASYVLALLVGLSAAGVQKRDSATTKDVCRQISDAISSASAVNLPGTRHLTFLSCPS